VHPFFKSVALAIGCVFALSATASENFLSATKPEILMREISPYLTVVVTQRDNIRCMEFEHRKGMPRMVQSCYDVDHPDKVWIDYNMLAFAAFIAKPNPKRVLAIGLGGGMIPHLIHKAYPDAEIDTVEINPLVGEVAQRDFPYRTDEKNHLHIGDGRFFVKKALSHGEQYDVIILDAFSKAYTPAHMVTQEFFTDVKRLLTPTGVLMANTIHHDGRLYDHESVTYKAVFGDFLTFSTPNGNRMLLAAKSPALLNKLLLNQQAKQMSDHSAYGIHYPSLMQHLDIKQDWNPDVRVLTDDWAPVELLRLMPR